MMLHCVRRLRHAEAATAGPAIAAGPVAVRVELADGVSTIRSAAGEGIAAHPALHVPPTRPFQHAEVLAVNQLVQMPDATIKG
jgi:hypothetical protein